MILFPLLAITLVAFPCEACVTTPPPNIPEPTPAPTSYCPSSAWLFISSNQMCYLLRKDAKDWYDARYDCTQQGRTGDLATVDNQFLDKQIIDYLIRLGVGPGGWANQVCIIRILLS